MQLIGSVVGGFEQGVASVAMNQVSIGRVTLALPLHSSSLHSVVSSRDLFVC